MFRGTYIQRWARVPVGFRVPRSEKTKEERDLGVVTMASAKPAAHCAKAARTAHSHTRIVSTVIHFGRNKSRHDYMMKGQAVGEDR